MYVESKNKLTYLVELTEAIDALILRSLDTSLVENVPTEENANILNVPPIKQISFAIVTLRLFVISTFWLTSNHYFKESLHEGS